MMGLEVSTRTKTYTKSTDKSLDVAQPSRVATFLGVRHVSDVTILFA